MSPFRKSAGTILTLATTPIALAKTGRRHVVITHRGQQTGAVRVVLLKCFLILTLGGAAHAQEDDFTFESDVEEHDGTTESALEAVLSDAAPATPVVQTPRTGLVWTGLPRLASDDGEYCIGRTWVQLPRDEVEAAEQNAWLALSYMFASIPELQGLYPTDDCPVEPADDVPPELLDDVVVETITDQLPRPAPSVPPGYAMTGMAAYLITDHELVYGPVDHDVDLEIMQLTVRVNGTATTTVDWGDGTVLTYDQPGLAYPDGEVTHTYADAGDVTIQITDSWRLTYDVYRGGELIISNVLEFDLAPVALENLEVRQLQSVRTSSN
jgi:hypothetical protein